MDAFRCRHGAAWILIAAAALLGAGARAQESPGEGGVEGTTSPSRPGLVYVIPIEDGPQIARGMVDPWQSFFVARHTEAAQEAGADVIVYQITTYGGMLDSAIEITTVITSVKSTPTVAYVVDRAISAGALISMACDQIYMQEGSQIGSAQAISADSEGKMRTVEEKFASVMRARFKMLAQQKGRNTALSEAMTDPKLTVLRVEVDGEETFVLEKELVSFQDEMEKQNKKVTVLDTAVAAGELLNMTYKDALEKYRFIDGVVADRAELLRVLGHPGATVVEPRASWPQEIARYIGGPAISGLLLSLAMLGLLMELYTPGKGIGGLIFLFGMALFFWSHFLGGQAGAVEIVLFLLGVALLSVEAFVIPGFGVAGVGGIVLIVLSLVMSFIPDSTTLPGVESLPFPWGRAQVALFTVLASILGSIMGLLILARFIPRAPFFRHMVLADSAGGGAAAAVAVSTEGGESKGLSALLGKTGVATTDLRPAGKVEIEGELVDAVTQAEFIEKGEPVEVTEAASFRVVVRRRRPGGGGDGGKA